MKIKKILSVLLIALTLFSTLSNVAFSLSWDGSSAGGSTNAVNGSNTGYVIRSTDDSAVVVGYRFSVMNSSGGMKSNKVIDVFRKTSNGNNAYSTSAKFSTKYNKKQVITNKDAKLNTTKNTTNCYKESDMGFTSALPNPSGVKTWQAYETNINKVLTKIGLGSVSKLSYGDKVIIEPLFDVCLAGEYQALTVSEIAYCGRSVKGGSSNGGTSNGTSSTWGFIANYTNRIWPNKLYTPDGQGLWTKATKIADDSKETFNNILTKGYGAGIAYSETTAPVLTICYDCYGSSVKSNGSTTDYKLGDYNRILSTTKTNKTIAGTKNVLYHTLKYDEQLGTNGLYNYSTFGLTTPTGYKFNCWHGAKGDFNQDTRYKASELSNDIKNGDTYEWLSAKFSPITYSVRFNGNGSTSGSMSNESFTYDTAKALTANAFKREFTVTYNYNGNGSSNSTAKATATFKGWAKTASGSVSYTDKQSVKNLSSTQGAVVDIYAKWTDGSVTLPTPTRTGYDFDGWYTSSSGGTRVGGGGSTYTPTANITLYAHWSVNSYTVTYNANGGSGAPASQTKTHGVSLTLSSVKPTRTGYTFKNWNTQSNGSGTTYNPGGTYTANSSVTLYAQWTPVTYTVTYNANGGSGAPAAQTKTHGVSLTLSSVKPTRYGYTFKCWNTQSNASGTNYSSGGLYTANSNVTLYAQWIPVTYKVTYNANGGSGAPASQTKTYGITLFLSNTKPTRTGYTFKCWNTQSNGYGTNYGSGSSYNVDADLTLYAQWTPVTYTVTYNANGGNNAPSAQTKTHGVSLALSTVKPTRTGYTFKNWNTQPGGGGTNYSSGSLYTSNANVTLYAQWTPVTYKVTYNANGGNNAPSAQTKTYGVNLTLTTSKPTRTGYTFVSWNTKTDGTGTTYNPGGSYTANADVTLYAQWEAVPTYTVTYNANGGNNAPSAQTKTHGVALTLTNAKATRTGYTFVSWNTKSDGTGTTYNPGGTYTANASVTLYAQWTPVIYTISYDANGGSNAPASQTKTYGASVTLSTVKPTRTGYIFKNWNKKADGSGTNYASGGNYTSNSSVTLYAQWTPITYEVKFNGNGHTSGTMNNQKFTYDVAQDLTANAYKREFTVTYDYSNGAENSTAKATATFKGWAKTASGSVSYNDKQNVINLASVQDTVVNIYAKWSDGSVILPTPTKTGYIFDGWYTTPDGTTKIGDGGDKYTPSKDITIYAHWKPITYTIVFNGNGHTGGSTASMTMTYDEIKNLNANGFVKTDYMFTNWNLKADGTGTVYTDRQSVKNLTAVNGATVTMYAEWKQGCNLSLQAITPNASYREGTEVISSFYLINEGTKECIPDDNVSVCFKVYRGSSVIKTVTLNNVVVPANNKNLLYFKWTVPADLGTDTIKITGEIIDRDLTYGLIAKTYSTCKYTVSATPDTQYAASAPAGFSVPAMPENKTGSATWSVWTYENGAFKKTNYGIAINDVVPAITPDASANATFSSNIWTMKSGYGFGITVNNTVKSLSGYTMPSADSYTEPQYSTVHFPEFSYLNTLNNYRTLELVSGSWVFRPNETYGRIHFTPLWYPDGLYSVSVVQEDCWTPAGMISRKINSNNITISGSAYDDWYLS